MNNKTVCHATIAAILSGTLIIGTTQSLASSKNSVEKCYGISVKAKNDCGTKTHACAAQARRSGDKQEWIYVLKGNCKRIVGGSLNPGA